jgi:hypothetical protein
MTLLATSRSVGRRTDNLAPSPALGVTSAFNHSVTAVSLGRVFSRSFRPSASSDSVFSLSDSGLAKGEPNFTCAGGS